MYLPLTFPPGAYLNGTEYQRKGRWGLMNLVRWYGEQIGPVGGWRIPSTNAVSGKARTITTWRTAANARWIGIGTNTKLYARSPSGTVSDITPSAFVTGNADETANTGFGTGSYGTLAYGVPRPDTGTVTEAMVWDLDVYTENLYACAFSDGRVVKWALNTGVAAAALTDAPTSCRGVVISEQGFVMAYGAGGDIRKIQWSDQNADTTWTPSATNQAGSIQLVTQGAIKKGLRLGSVVLYLTDIDAHIAQYVGLPAVFSFQRVGDDCGAVSKGCVVGMGAQAVWWSKSGFWRYDGGVSPIPCDVWEYLQDNLNAGQRSKITAFHNHQFGEAWWFYPSIASTQNDSYVYWDYRRNHWGTGSLGRASMAEAGVFQYPIGIDSSGNIYEHEVGVDWDDATPYAESGPVELGSGDRVMRCSEVLADEATNGQVTVSFRYRAYPNATETTSSESAFDTNGRALVRFAARQVKVRLTSSANDDWRVGTMRIGLTPGGYR